MHRRTRPAGNGFRMGGLVMVGLVEDSGIRSRSVLVCSVECKDELYLRSIVCM